MRFITEMRSFFVYATLLLGVAFGFSSSPTSRGSRPKKYTWLSSSSGSSSTIKLEPGQILVASTDKDPTQFDTACVVNPVVIPPSEAYDKWQLYYYGNFGQGWNDGSQGFVPTGWCGLAESDDGINWKKVAGPLERGAIFAPSDDPNEWDSVHVGVNDIVRRSPQELHMYYFGGSSEKVEELGGFTGVHMRIGRAKSLDNGRTWERMGMVLDYDKSEGLFASWPRIIKSSTEPSGKTWQMVYHAFDGSKWRVFGATSTDQGATWTRKGLLLEGEDNADSFDVNGIGTRAVAAPWKGGALMVFEGVNKNGTHQLGAAYCSDVDGNGPWEKMDDLAGCSEPGGPIASPGVGSMKSWTTTVVGTPYLVPMPDGSLRLYHCGRSDGKGHSIGLQISDSGGVSPECWRPAIAGDEAVT